jgi:hypothetical protein
MDQPRRPAFANEFPRTPDLDAIVTAFARGDYASVRARAISLERSSSEPEVRQAARVLFDRTRPDGLAVALLGITALLLVTMASWWVVHGHAPP